MPRGWENLEERDGDRGRAPISGATLARGAAAMRSEAMIPGVSGFRDIGERLRIARGRSGMTQADAAAGIDVARTTLLAMEKGRRRVAFDEIRKLARLYDTSVNALLRHESVFVDLVSRVRGLETGGGEAAREAARLLGDLVQAEIELENLIGITRTHDLPPKRPLMPGDARAQAEDDAGDMRRWLGLGRAPVSDMVGLLEMDLGVRVYIRPCHSSIAGLFAHDGEIGACLLLNADHPGERRAETAARALGVLAATRGDVRILDADGKETSRGERYANAFGRAFLTPTRAVACKFEDVTVGASRLARRHVILLARDFGVSREAMARRLEELKLVGSGAWNWFVSNGGIADEQAARIPGDSRAVDMKQCEAELPTTARLGLLAAEAWRRELLSEGQLARLLRLDRIGLRRILDDAEDEREQADGGPELLQ